MQEIKEDNDRKEGNEGVLSEQQRQELAAAYKRAQTVRKILIAIGILIFLCVVVYVVSNSKACVESAMEEVSEPKLVGYLGGYGMKPGVSVEVKNKSNDPIKVRFECVVYDVNGNKSTTVSSSYELIMPGDTVKIVGTASESYYFSEYAEKCASISKLNYSVLKQN